ncbi:MAG: ribosomal-processing cysteine protease Prp [Ruminococcus sp.]|nr:ribosomal-processing cysteine protease Prp [Ruminococcus sp.]
MINIEIFGSSLVLGFEIKGHAGYGEYGSDIVCSAVSSAAFMTANTITEIIGVNPELLICDEGLMKLKLDESSAQKCSDILDGFVLHVRSLSKEYKKYMKVTISEV